LLVPSEQWTAGKTGWAAKIRRERHIGEFEHWKEHDSYQKAFQRLLRDLKTAQDE
jgi:hypothetical protein